MGQLTCERPHQEVDCLQVVRLLLAERRKCVVDSPIERVNGFGPRVETPSLIVADRSCSIFLLDFQSGLELANVPQVEEMLS